MGGIGIVYYQNNSEVSLDGKRIDFFLRWTITEKVTRNFIYIGISIIFLVLSFEFLYGNNAIGQSSTLVLIFSLVLLLYDFIPTNPTIKINPPYIGFSLLDEKLTPSIDCFVFDSKGQVEKELFKFNERVEIRLKRKLTKGRSRVNCTAKGNDNIWRWFGHQFYL